MSFKRYDILNENMIIQNIVIRKWKPLKLWGKKMQAIACNETSPHEIEHNEAMENA